MQSSRVFEISMIVAIMVAVLIGGRSLVFNIAQFHGLSIGMLVILAVVIVYAFRRNFRSGGPLVRLHATRDAAYLAAIAAAVCFVVSPARWSLGATVAGVEFGLIVELFSRFLPTPEV